MANDFTGNGISYSQPLYNSTMLTSGAYSPMGAQTASPFTVGATAVSGVAGIFSAMFGAMAAKGQRKYQAESLALSAQHTKFVADTNSRIAELGAQSALIQGQRQVGALRLRQGKIKGAQRAAMAANGIDLGVGSAVEVAASTDLMAEIDANTIEANAIQSAWGYRTQGAAQQLAANTQSANLLAESNSARFAADQISPMTAGASSLMSGAQAVSREWYRYQRGQ